MENGQNHHAEIESTVVESKSAASSPSVDINDIASAVLVAAAENIDEAKKVIVEFSPTMAASVVLYCLPDDWRDQDAAALLAKLDDDGCALLLAWIARQWWEGYSIGHHDGQIGNDLRS